MSGGTEYATRLREVEAELARARETNVRLNRRVQAAESALAERGTPGPSLGRAAANYSARAQRERAEAAESALSSSEAREKALREALGAHVKDWRAAARIRRNAEPDVPFVAGRSEGYALALAICAGLVEDALRAALASDPDATRGGPTP